MVVDCSGSREMISWMIRNNILVELDYETAKRWETVSRGIEIERFVGWRIISTVYPDRPLEREGQPYPY